MFTNNKEQANRIRRVAFYGRVSTEHEEQLYALRNQMQWYEELCRYFPNWHIVNRYTDDGITGTQTKKRPEFMRMIEDAKSGKFDLIVTREVARFARNTIDCLEVTRQLKKYGVEVFFVQDGIWTLDNEGEMIFTIRAMVAQEESRKMSERVKAGQAISRKNGVIYGSGTLLGYDKVEKNYVVNFEQAETVRLIFNLYESGLGMQAIRNELIRLGRKNAKGNVEWDTTRISRCLKNTIYKGVIGYNKTFRNNYLEQKIVVNRDESKHIYIKGNFDPIISEEQWDHCKHIRESRVVLRAINSGNETTLVKLSSCTTNSVWTNKLRCRCGSSMRMNKWRKRKDGVKPTGYKCYNQLNNGAGKITDASIEGFCIIKAICGWKLELMALFVFRRLFKIKEIYDNAVNILMGYMFTDKNEKKVKLIEYENRIKRLGDRLERLLEMRADGELDKEKFLLMKSETEASIQQVKQELLNYERGVEARKPYSKEEISKHLSTILKDKTIKIDEELINIFVKNIKVISEHEFLWIMDFGSECNKELEFTIPFRSAQKFRNARNELLRNNQYVDLRCKICY